MAVSNVSTEVKTSGSTTGKQYVRRCSGGSERARAKPAPVAADPLRSLLKATTSDSIPVDYLETSPPLTGATTEKLIIHADDIAAAALPTVQATTRVVSAGNEVSLRENVTSESQPDNDSDTASVLSISAKSSTSEARSESTSVRSFNSRKQHVEDVPTAGSVKKHTKTSSVDNQKMALKEGGTASVSRVSKSVSSSSSASVNKTLSTSAVDKKSSVTDKGKGKALSTVPDKGKSKAEGSTLVSSARTENVRRGSGALTRGKRISSADAHASPLIQSLDLTSKSVSASSSSKNTLNTPKPVLYSILSDVSVEPVPPHKSQTIIEKKMPNAPQVPSSSAGAIATAKLTLVGPTNTSVLSEPVANSPVESLSEDSSNNNKPNNYKKEMKLEGVRAIVRAVTAITTLEDGVAVPSTLPHPGSLSSSHSSINTDDHSSTGTTSQHTNERRGSGSIPRAAKKSSLTATSNAVPSSPDRSYTVGSNNISTASKHSEKEKSNPTKSAHHVLSPSSATASLLTVSSPPRVENVRRGSGALTRGKKISAADSNASPMIKSLDLTTVSTPLGSDKSTVLSQTISSSIKRLNRDGDNNKKSADNVRRGSGGIPRAAVRKTNETDVHQPSAKEVVLVTDQFDFDGGRSSTVIENKMILDEDNVSVTSTTPSTSTVGTEKRKKSLNSSSSTSRISQPRFR